jgi:hypothetical protein
MPSVLKQARENEVTYSFQKVEGILALPSTKVELEEELAAGDTVFLFYLPSGKILLSKSYHLEALKISKITSAFIYFDGEQVTMEES